MKELDVEIGMRMGADVRWSAGESDRGRLEVYDLGNDHHYSAFEVDESGAIIEDEEGRTPRMHFADLGESGVDVLIGTNNNPRLKPGESMEVNLGELTFEVEGNDSKGVTLNGEPLPMATKFSEYILWPDLQVLNPDRWEKIQAEHVESVAAEPGE